MISGLLAYFWRMGVSFTLALAVIIGYSSISGCGIIEKKTEPVVEHNFQMDGKFTGGEELWVNNVYLGKLPLTITGKEFNEKVPFMETPPDGYREDNPYEPAGPWKVLVMHDTRLNGVPDGLDQKIYYVKIMHNDQLVSNYFGNSGGGGGTYRRYKYRFSGSFPDRDILLKKEGDRLNLLLDKARLNNYAIDKDWYNAYQSHTGLNLQPLRNKIINEPGFARTMAELARYKYNIPETLDQKAAQSVFEDICQADDQAKLYLENSIEGQAVELIYDKLDLNYIVKKLSARLKDKSRRHSSALLHAARLWDEKLDKEQPDKDNLVEKKITPILIDKWDDVDRAAVFGGIGFEKYVLRRYDLQPAMKVKFGSGDHYWQGVQIDGMYLNKWLVMLVNFKSKIGREFLDNNSDIALELARLQLRANGLGSPPDYLFFDLDRGNNSLAMKFWPEYLREIRSFPGNEAYDFRRKCYYLSKLGDLATEQMYLNCWKKVDVTKSRSISDVFKHVPDTIRLSVLLDIRNNPNLIFELGWGGVIDKELIILGDEQALAKLVASDVQTKSQRVYDVLLHQREMNRDEMVVYDMFAHHSDPDLRRFCARELMRQPTVEKYAILQELAADPDPTVKQAAQTALAELDKIRLIPYSELVSLQEDYAAGKLK